MRMREFISELGAAACPLVARAQQQYSLGKPLFLDQSLSSTLKLQAHSTGMLPHEDAVSGRTIERQIEFWGQRTNIVG
jgi:hypothetical protein